MHLLIFCVFQHFPAAYKLINDNSYMVSMFLQIYDCESIQYTHSTVCLQLSFTHWLMSFCWLSMLASVTCGTVGVSYVTNSFFIHCTCHVTPPYLDIPPSQSHVLHTHIPLSPSPPPMPQMLCLPLGLNPSISWKKPNVLSFHSPQTLIFALRVDQMNIPCSRA